MGVTIEGSHDTRNAIEAFGISKAFSGKTALADVGFSVARGRIYAVVGRNGAGKTTLFEILAGIQRRFLGGAIVCGCDVRGDPELLHERVAYVPTQPSLYKWMSIGRAVAFARSMHVRWNDELCERLMDRLGLRPTERIATLSHGTIIKVAILLALSYEPEVLLVDEATSNLDIVTRRELLQLLRASSTEAHATVLISSHVISDVDKYADEIGLIKDGRMLCSEPLADLQGRVKRLRLSGASNDLASRLPVSTLVDHREKDSWQLIVSNYREEMLEQIVAEDHCRAEVDELTLEEIVRAYLGDFSVAAVQR